MSRIASPSAFVLLIPVVFLLGCEPSGIGASKSDPLDARYGMETPPPDGAPTIPNTSVLRPFFQTSLGGIDAGQAAGTAFGISLEDNSAPIVLTALSILGPVSGLSREANPTELNDITRIITLGDAFGSTDGVITASNFLLIPESASYSTKSPAGDILAINMPAKSKLKTFKLATVKPNIGDRVWLSAALFVGASPSQRQHSAKVTGVDELGNITYAFDNEKLSFQGTAGAPMLNDSGEIVAVHLNGTSEEGKRIGFGNPTSRFKSFIESARSKSKEGQ